MGAALVSCCIVCLPNLYDKCLIGRFLLTTMCLSFFFAFLLFSKNKLQVPKSKLFLAFVAVVLFFVASVSWATNKGEAVFALSTQLLMLLVAMVFYYLLSTDYQSVRKTLWICCGIILVVYLGFAFYQMLSIEDLSFEQLYTVSGINGHKNLLSVMLFLLSAFLLGSIPFIKRKVLKAIPLLLFVVAIGLVVLLKSRAALLSVMAAAFFFGLLALVRRLKPRLSRGVKTSILVVSNLLVLAFFIVGLRWLVGRPIPHTASKSEVEYNIVSTSSLVERCLMWDKTYRIVDKHPVLGCGIGNWQIHFPDAGLKGLYRCDFWNVNFTKPHNEYLGVLSEGGYLGFILFIVFWVSLVVCSVFALCEVEDRKEFVFGAVVLCIFIGSSVDAMFDFPNSRIEHVVWIGILCALLFRIVVGNRHKSLGKGYTAAILLVSAMMVVVGCFRYKGERNAFAMQQALRQSDWVAMERYSSRAISVFYTIDPLGIPMHWYWGKAAEKNGNPWALSCLRKAYYNAPYCRENLNDLGLEEYYVAHNLPAAEFCFREAIRISPGYLYSYFNLAYIYLDINEPNEAHMVADQIYMSEEMRDVMMEEAVFFEPYNAEAIRQKIQGDYEAAKQLRQAIFQFEAKEGSMTNDSSSER